ncbi:hypothetical protein RM717_30655 [Streptomyces griseus]|uniref:Secreted protein n=2 Tax=Streptomycetaceae TaxID=2062 RepID=A0ABU2WAG6_9ACTN|nr:hypothetical protein [Streptomyces griseus]ARF72760.1 hypothetical protein B7C62_11100 [Kitasatospora albolonga]MDT0494861.1 hypothetical protein [Streptomyces griseus]
MPRSNVRRRTAAVAAVIGLALSGSVLTAPAAQAAPKLTWKETALKENLKKDGSRSFQLYHHPHNIGAVTWAADPLVGIWTGDTLYINDKRSDGYYVVGQVKQVSTGKTIININTKGKTAPSEVKKTKNLKEGTKIQFRACIKKGSTNHGCTSWFSAKA